MTAILKVNSGLCNSANNIFVYQNKTAWTNSKFYNKDRQHDARKKSQKKT